MSTLAKKLNAALNLTSKLAVVSGGSQGIGAGVAMRFAEVSFLQEMMAFECT